MVYGKSTHHTVIDEEASTCVMFISCWRAIGSPQFATSQTILKAFDGHTFHPHGILISFPIYLWGKIIPIEVEVVDAPLDYKLILGNTWFYEMKVVPSSIF